MRETRTRCAAFAVCGSFCSLRRNGAAELLHQFAFGMAAVL